MVGRRDGVTGALLVGGASRRFSSPKALAQFEGEPMAERMHRILGEAFGEVIAVGKEADGLPLSFPVLDDGSGLRAPIVGVAAALRLSRNAVCVVVPTDMPWLTPRLLVALADAALDADAAVPTTGPLPGAYRRACLPVLERRLAAGELALRDALGELVTATVEADASELRNVNRPADLA